jgi:pyruvate ferredoxin oxidoreductase delta subunit
VKKKEEYKMTAKELCIGDIVDFNPLNKFYTGNWRSRKKPILDKNKCINCLICWISCPDSSIKVVSDDAKISIVDNIDYNFCKGCGICAMECKNGAIKMEEEKK